MTASRQSLRRITPHATIERADDNTTTALLPVSCDNWHVDVLRVSWTLGRFAGAEFLATRRRPVAVAFHLG